MADCDAVERRKAGDLEREACRGSGGGAGGAAVAAGGGVMGASGPSAMDNWLCVLFLSAPNVVPVPTETKQNAGSEVADCDAVERCKAGDLEREACRGGSGGGAGGAAVAASTKGTLASKGVLGPVATGYANIEEAASCSKDSD